MSTLKIIKLQSGAFEHVDSIDGDFFLGRFNFKQEFNKAFLVEAYGAKRRQYSITEVEVFDFGGTAEPFTNWTDLINRLVDLGYTGIDTNSIPSGGGVWGSITGNIASQTDLQNELNTKLDKVTTTDVEKVYIKNADGTQGMKPVSEFGGGAFEQRTGDEISFDKNSIYNKTTPISTDVDFDLTNAILGNKAIVFHNSTSTPSFLGVNLKGIIGYYIPNETNIIELIFLGGTDIIAEIKNQNTLLAPFDFDYSVSGGNLILTWDSYIDSNFIIERSTTSDFATKTQVYSGSALTYTDAVSVGVSYFYRIKSIKDNFTDSLWNIIQADNFYVGFLTFTNAKKNLLTALPNNEYTTSSTTNYEAYGNSDYKIPANTYGFIEINTPDLAKEGSLFGFASTDVNGGFTLTKFAFLTGVGTTLVAPFQNGVYIAGDISNGYSAGANAKLRMVREVSGVCKVFKTTDSITWVLVYTFPENYTGELYLIINV